jgi:hypothetical protein
MAINNKLVRVPVKKVWFRNGGENCYLQGDTFHVSYNMHPSLWGDEGEETALVKDGNYYILLGDFRDEYEQLIDEGFEACKKFFDSKPELRGSWSN